MSAPSCSNVIIRKKKCFFFCLFVCLDNCTSVVLRTKGLQQKGNGSLCGLLFQETLKLCLLNTFLNSSVFALLIILGYIANSHSIILMSTLYEFLPLGLLYPTNNYSFAIWSVCQLAVSEKKIYTTTTLLLLARQKSFANSN